MLPHLAVLYLRRWSHLLNLPTVIEYARPVLTNWLRPANVARHDKGKVTAHVLFRSICGLRHYRSHVILPSRLHTAMGIAGTALKWFHVQGKLHRLSCDVPKESVLMPFLYEFTHDLLNRLSKSKISAFILCRRCPTVPTIMTHLRLFLR